MTLEATDDGLFPKSPFFLATRIGVTVQPSINPQVLDVPPLISLEVASPVMRGLMKPKKGRPNEPDYESWLPVSQTEMGIAFTHAKATAVLWGWRVDERSTKAPDKYQPQTKELVLFLTPRIIRPDNETLPK